MLCYQVPAQPNQLCSGPLTVSCGWGRYCTCAYFRRFSSTPAHLQAKPKFKVRNCLLYAIACTSSISLQYIFERFFRSFMSKWPQWTPVLYSTAALDESENWRNESRNHVTNNSSRCQRCQFGTADSLSIASSTMQPCIVTSASL